MKLAGWELDGAGIRIEAFHAVGRGSRTTRRLSREAIWEQPQGFCYVEKRAEPLWSVGVTSLEYIPGFLFLAGIVGFFLFLRFLEYQVRRARQKRLAQLAAWPCPRCGVPFGAEAADAARKEGEKRMAEAMKDAKERGIRLRVVTRWPVTCRQCGETFIFRPDTDVLSSTF